MRDVWTLGDLGQSLVRLTLSVLSSGRAGAATVRPNGCGLEQWTLVHVMCVIVSEVTVR